MAKKTTMNSRVSEAMMAVLISIGSVDLLFALDSIPAVFGITREPFIVFAANAFALLGLRALFFLVKGLLDRLVYLSTGLSIILAFIGVKLVLHALHERGVPMLADHLDFTETHMVIPLVDQFGDMRTLTDRMEECHIIGGTYEPPEDVDSHGLRLGTGTDAAGYAGSGFGRHRRLHPRRL